MEDFEESPIRQRLNKKHNKRINGKIVVSTKERERKIKEFAYKTHLYSPNETELDNWLSAEKVIDKLYIVQ